MRGRDWALWCNVTVKTLLLGLLLFPDLPQWEGKGMNMRAALWDKGIGGVSTAALVGSITPQVTL